MKSWDADVVVTGAGPGGTVLAYLLARSGVKTVLVERHRDLSREFRGYFFQPLVLKLFHQMGLLETILSLGHRKEKGPCFYDRGQRLFEIRLDRLSDDYPYGINMPQPPLLELLIKEASRYPTFSYRGGTQVIGLLREEGKTAGVRLRTAAGEEKLRARLTVGADGRYSTVRRLAEIPQRTEPHRLDLVWLSVPLPRKKEIPMQFRVEEEGMLIYVPMYPDQVQLGWFIPKGSYPVLKKEGIEAFREKLSSVDPGLKEHLERELTDFSQCSLLQIISGRAKRWTEAGLMIIGDAAHTSSPFSGQGNSLAIQDAVVAHPIILEALAGGRGILPQKKLTPFEAQRRPSIRRIQQMQRMQARLLGTRHPLEAWLRRQLLPRLARTPLFHRMQHLIAWGDQPLKVAADRFRAIQ
ncbi:FAD-dependent monooxygenase [Salinithrix halophila]|uniref:FAD-dependent monooxygenase n=1 Tax=Salinithrix halophila TaxID=1485204 RepID=A0ABV8JE05_9BACL